MAEKVSPGALAGATGAEEPCHPVLGASSSLSRSSTSNQLRGMTRAPRIRLRDRIAPEIREAAKAYGLAAQIDDPQIYDDFGGLLQSCVQQDIICQLMWQHFRALWPSRRVYLLAEIERELSR
jgi:hypothetical protein